MPILLLYLGYLDAHTQFFFIQASLKKFNSKVSKPVALAAPAVTINNSAFWA
jgi:hypothetical protein